MRAALFERQGLENLNVKEDVQKPTIEGLSESIAYELETFGIKVILIEPGPIRSNFMKVFYL